MPAGQIPLDCDNAFFSARAIGQVLVFSFKGNLLTRSTLIKAKTAVLDYLRAVEQSEAVSVVVLMPRPRKARREEYLLFFDMVASRKITRDSLLRMYRAIDQFILQVMASGLFFISAECGQVLPVFANLAMACDYRIVADNTVYQNPALELGLAPKGGGAWFLKQRLGRSKAFELLLCDKTHMGREAVELGIADCCVPAADFEKEVLAVAQRFAAKPKTSLKLAKRLVNAPADNLESYLDYENKELLKAIDRMLLDKT